MRRVLIVDCMPPEYDPLLDSLRVPGISEAEQTLLRTLQPDIQCSVARAADVDEPLPGRSNLDDFDGVLWSGTPLSVMDDVPGMRRQLELMRTVFDAGLPVFGICGGLQVGVEVAGGKVARNPHGLESGICRNILPTAAGRQHPMFQFRDGAFDALGDHFDYAERLPPGAVPLAANTACTVQATAFRAGSSDFWGVQYHPDFMPAHLRALAELRADDWQKAGLVRDRNDVEFIKNAVHQLENGSSERATAWLLGMGCDILDPWSRAAEVRAWLDHY